MSNQQNIENLSYEQARDELVTTVRRLEQGGVTLNESLELWKYGEALAAKCESWLVGAKQQLEQAQLAGAQSGDAAHGSAGDSVSQAGTQGNPAQAAGQS